MQIIGLVGYTIPLFGNRRCLPYGKLIVSVDGARRVCPIRDAPDGTQYITVNRKRYPVVNAGRLYAPVYKFI